MSATMVMKWATGVSLQVNTETALAEVFIELKEKLAGAQPDAALLFVSPQHRPRFARLGEAVMNQLAPKVLVGCSGGGIIGGGFETERAAAITVATAILPNVAVTPFHIEDAKLPDPDSSPRKWEEMSGVKASTHPHFIVLADPYSIRADELLAGLDFAYPQAVKLGGLVSGGTGPGQNALYLNGTYFRNGAVCLALSGDLEVDTLVAQGCRPIGKPMQITRCQRNILIELDKRRAIEVLTELFEQSGERDRGLIRTSLFLGLVMDRFKKGPPRAGDFLIRNLMGMDTDRGALAIGAVLREGQTVQFHVREAAAAHEDLAAVLRRHATEHLNAAGGASLPAPPRGALLFSCLGRGEHLYGQPDHDSKSFFAEFGGVPLAGFFCNGEIGPVGGTTYIHGFTSCFGIFRPKHEQLVSRKDAKDSKIK